MSSKLKAGTYELSPDMTFDDIVYTLQEGNVADAEIDIQFIEGRTVEEYGKVHIQLKHLLIADQVVPVSYTHLRRKGELSWLPLLPMFTGFSR